MWTKTNKNNLLLIVVGFLVFILFTTLSVYVFFNKSILDNTNESSLSKITRSESDSGGVIDELGKPEAIEKSGAFTVYKYPTLSDEFKDLVFFEDQTVVASKEHVFDNSNGFLEDYLDRLGIPDLKMYDLEDELILWFIFLDKGVGVAAFETNEVARVLYFVPQSRENFMNKTAGTLGLTLKKPIIVPDEV